MLGHWVSCVELSTWILESRDKEISWLEAVGAGRGPIGLSAVASSGCRRSWLFGSIRSFPGAFHRGGGARLVSHGTRLSVITVQSLRHDLRFPLLLLRQQGVGRARATRTHRANDTSIAAWNRSFIQYWSSFAVKTATRVKEIERMRSRAKLSRIGIYTVIKVTRQGTLVRYTPSCYQNKVFVIAFIKINVYDRIGHIN